MKKKFENFLKQLGDSPKKKRNISANGSRVNNVPPGQNPQVLVGRDVVYPLFGDVVKRFISASGIGGQRACPRPIRRTRRSPTGL